MLDAVFQYKEQLLQGLLMTLGVAVGSLVVGSLIAVVLAPLAIYGNPVTRRIIMVYVSLIRGLPELLVIFLIFYGGTVLLTNLTGSYVEVDAMSAGIAALSVVAAAYLTEILRGALLSVSAGQWEAALSLGFRRPRAFRLVILPQMMARALPGLGNQWLVILKESALVSVVGLEELMRKSVVAAGATNQPLAFYLTAAGLYVSITGVSTLLLKAYESRLTSYSR
ncbi:ABC transporter permease [Rhizobium laguerreae]|uniref:ABC transporter permease n=1 Tax=Rhizobium laguerreae TaxID=1076926 RepID=UPI001C91C46E|nr:ABC transporter permease subunit [Rhizobium laguerreae]MBY3348382.1 ABC transporter permease subunit [Rhizobium laguerreae]MBY3355400.1 ABC transporter permease subunit [Rhizobium laguerreae]MBY3369285.1 ABC transporter permease subunit [Rhizobium laguerreae]MBY3376536.1 ABC transporter permease subunit [Rhizobium laguerreae]MBY3390604.1 ABC transporter permease subunit [Rhizobium laguerreae]